jgi:DNA-binding MarR family transcriptional regulator
LNQHADNVSTVTPYDRRPGYLLKRAQHALRLAMDRALDEIGLTTPRYAALSALDREPDLTNATLATRCFVTPQTMHRVVGQLADQGLLERGDERGRGRSQRLRVTEEGAELLERAHQVIEKIEVEMVAGVDPADLAATVRTLERAAEALDR